MNSDSNTIRFRASEQQKMDQAGRFKITGEAEHHQSFIIKGFPGEYDKLMSKLNIPGHGADRVDIQSTLKMLAFRPGDKWVVEDIRSAENFVNQMKNLDPKVIQNLSNSERELVNYLNERFPAYIQNQRGVLVTPPAKIPLNVD
jgi:hypothetical protein